MDVFWHNDLNYSIGYGTVAIIGYRNNEVNIIIPATVSYLSGSYSVSFIETRAFMYLNLLKKVTIPNSVIFVGDQAFESCGSLTEIVFQGNQLELGGDVFFNTPLEVLPALGSHQQVAAETYTP